MSRSRTDRRRAVVVLLAFTLPTLVLASGVADAAWTTSGAGGGTGGTYVVPAGTQPSGRATASQVILSWAPVTLSGGQAVGGYLVYRTDAATGGRTPAGPGCSGVVTTNHCIESPVTAGTWIYSDVPVLNSWSGPAGPGSSPITVP